jgi:hypothetical protein
MKPDDRSSTAPDVLRLLPSVTQAVHRHNACAPTPPKRSDRVEMNEGRVVMEQQI